MYDQIKTGKRSNRSAIVIRMDKIRSSQSRWYFIAFGQGNIRYWHAQSVEVADDTSVQTIDIDLALQCRYSPLERYVILHLQ